MSYFATIICTRHRSKKTCMDAVKHQLSEQVHNEKPQVPERFNTIEKCKGLLDSSLTGVNTVCRRVIIAHELHVKVDTKHPCYEHRKNILTMITTEHGGKQNMIYGREYTEDGFKKIVLVYSPVVNGSLKSTLVNFGLKQKLKQYAKDNAFTLKYPL